MNNESEYHLYILLCDQKILYTGIAIDPETRLSEHQKGHPNGAKFTRRFKHLKLVYQVKVGTRSDAQSLEIKVKKLNKQNRLYVINNKLSLTELNTLLADK